MAADRKRLPLARQLLQSMLITVALVLAVVMYYYQTFPEKMFNEGLRIKADTLRNYISATLLYEDDFQLVAGGSVRSLHTDAFAHELDRYVEQIHQYDDDLEYFALYEIRSETVPASPYDRVYLYRMEDGGETIAPTVPFASVEAKLYDNIDTGGLTTFLFPLSQYEARKRYLLEFGFSQRRLDEARNEFLALALVIFAVFMGGMMLIVWRSWQLTHPVRQLAAVAQRFGTGDFDARAPVTGSRETAALGENFNEMAVNLAARINELQLINQRSRELSYLVERNRTMNRIVTLLGEAVHATTGLLYLVTEESVAEQPIAGYGDAPALLGREIMERTLRENRSVTVFVEGFHYCCLPLVHEWEKLGVVVCGRPSTPFDTWEEMLLDTLGAQASTSLANATLYEQVVTDALTGVFLRRFLFMRLKEELRRPETATIPFTLLMMDLDDFKKINDTHGHPAGDAVLQAVAGVLFKNIRYTDAHEASRTSDVVARYGGEEFVVLLPLTPLPGGKVVAERIREGVAALRVDHAGQQLHLTISIGVAEYRSGDTPEAVIGRADKALYRAKQAGKNRVCEAEG